ncbi:hypothetical protein FDZ73_21105 [bacterium]|nr:MAG: hypothetical protein FDZ73_21105 [bacterium]
MNILRDLFAPPYPARQREEVDRLLTELIQIGKMEDFLSERPGGAFNVQSRHIRAIQIGKRLDEIGGLPMMEFAKRRVRRRLGAQLTSHLDYCWEGIGKWSA